MVMEPIFSNEFIEILFHPEKKLLVQRWSSKFLRFSEFKDAIDKTLELFKQYHAERLMSDASSQKVLAGSSSDFAVSYVPSLGRYGMKKMALVLPDDIFLRRKIYSFSLAVKEQSVKPFDTEEEAMAWLCQ